MNTRRSRYHVLIVYIQVLIAVRQITRMETPKPPVDCCLSGAKQPRAAEGGLAMLVSHLLPGCDPSASLQEQYPRVRKYDDTVSPGASSPPPPGESFDAVIHMQENPPQKRFLAGCSSPFMRLAKHLTALRAWCKQCLLGR